MYAPGVCLSLRRSRLSLAVEPEVFGQRMSFDEFVMVKRAPARAHIDIHPSKDTTSV
jgi:hypothetical protein